MLDDAGQIEFVIGAGTDVTAARALESARRESEARFRAIFDEAAIGISLVGADFKPFASNAAMERFFGSSASELQARGFAAVSHPDDLPAGMALYDAMRLGRGEHFRIEKRYWHRDGHVIWGEVTLSPVRDAEGRLQFHLAMIQDITERRQLERMKNELIATASHELRTPLTGLYGAIKLIASGVSGPLSPEAQHMANLAVESSERMIRLVNDFLDYQRLEHGLVRMHHGGCDAGALLARAAEALAPAAERAGVTLELPEDSAPVWADEERAIQALQSLLSNAIKCSTPGAPVTLELTAREQETVLTVRDRGPGIAPDRLVVIFDRLRQADMSDSRPFGGMGLGLAICRQIVEQLGGRVWAESELGQGSAFHIALPARAPLTA